MAKCDLRIEFDKQQRQYFVGDVVRGRIHVDVTADCTCNGLNLEGLWRAHGRGNQYEQTCFTETAFTGQWLAGSSESYPFEFKVPAGPLTYHGHNLNVDWYISATVDIPWALDPSTEEDFVVAIEPGDDVIVSIGSEGALPELEKYLGESASSVDGFEVSGLEVNDGSQSMKSLKPLIAFIFLGFTMVFGCVFGSLGLSEFGYLGLCFTLFPLGIGLTGFFFMLRNTIAERKLGEVKVELEPGALVAPGGQVTVNVRFCPKVAVDVTSIIATFNGQERVIRGSGSNRTTHTHELFDSSITLCDSRQIGAGEEVVLTGQMELPDDAQYSFGAGDNFLEWKANVHIDIPRWPDWSSLKVFIVYPKTAIDALYGDSHEKASQPSTRPSTPAPKVEARAPAIGPSSETSKATTQSSSSSSEMTLEQALEQLTQASFSSDREKIFERCANSPFEFELTVQSVKETTSLDALAGRNDGQTVLGIASGIEGKTVAVQFDKSLNDETKTLQPGDQLTVKAQLQGWSSLDKRAILGAEV
jgi:hypothetical protein